MFEATLVFRRRKIVTPRPWQHIRSNASFTKAARKLILFQNAFEHLFVWLLCQCCNLNHAGLRSPRMNLQLAPGLMLGSHFALTDRYE